MTPKTEIVPDTLDEIIDPSIWFEDADEILECGIENPEECEACG